PELPRCPTARALLESAPFREALEALRRQPLVDHRRLMALKRQALEELAQCAFAGDSPSLMELHCFAREHPVAADYARFRAAGERQRAPWPAWPAPQRDGVLKEGDYDETASRYHLYVQWLAHQQIGDLSQKAREKGVRLYFDLPLGVHPDGYDVWRERDAFVRGVSAGAPPDTFFVKGQDWGLPPPHPERLREQGYRYYIACLRHQLQYAGILRIDHVMGFHRLFYVPHGLPATQGVYVRYRAQEFYAILALESRRHNAIILGEDLGTVPPQVRPAMARHRLLRSYVAQYSVSSRAGQVLGPGSADMVASLNTHDMPTFAAFWEGLDILDREDLGLLDEDSAYEEFKARQGLKDALVGFLRQGGWMGGEGVAVPQTVLSGLLACLGHSPASTVLVNLEDLWLETQPQNVPGTREERPNWRRRAAHPLEAFSRMPEVAAALREVDRYRREGKP
ncbi:MAG: 4-alpha-glucanotransferase, partial [Chloroflexota bacterium]